LLYFQTFTRAACVLFPPSSFLSFFYRDATKLATMVQQTALRGVARSHSESLLLPPRCVRVVRCGGCGGSDSGTEMIIRIGVYCRFLVCPVRFCRPRGAAFFPFRCLACRRIGGRRRCNGGFWDDRAALLLSRTSTTKCRVVVYGMN